MGNFKLAGLIEADDKTELLFVARVSVLRKKILEMPK